MDTNNLKRFATEARKRLKDGVAAKLMTLGFKRDGSVADGMTPELHQGGSTWRGEIKTETFYHQWMALRNAVQQRGVQQVFEEAAYTWFNRFVAIRILQKNELCEPMLVFSSPMTPRIVDNAREGIFPTMAEAERKHLSELMTDDTKVAEQFAILITAFCHENDIIRECFGSIDTYNELLLPTNILAEGGFLDMLNHTEFLTDEDFRTTELIGWLYQFYISERKDEVFAKKGKFEAEEIPAATQIFTPNWIVKYMVQNTIGRIYLDNNAGSESKWKGQWKYLVEPAEKPAEESILKYGELTDIKAADLACGSGHILGELFDMLYDLYIYEGYTRREAIENIFRQNLSGIDLDMRAKQLATFALLLKASQKDASFADCHVMPNVLTMHRAFSKSGKGSIEEFLPHFFLGEGNKENYAEIADCFRLMEDADSLGSIMKFNISGSTRALIKLTVEHWESKDIVPEAIADQMPAFKLMLALTEKYHALVMNPPYMGSGNMNGQLSKYAKDNYPRSKADLMSVFMDVAIDRLAEKGKYGMINMHSWMFLSSFEELRRHLLNNQKIDSLLHLGPRTFDELSGEVVQNAAFVIENVKADSMCGTYFRLVDGKSCADKERLFLETQENHGAKIYYPNIEQKNFEKIPGCPIGYWVSEKELKIIGTNRPLSAVCKPTQGLATADNGRFVRHWQEVVLGNIGFKISSIEESILSKKKWFPYNKGGDQRKWYGNQTYVVNWENDGFEIKHFVDEKGKQRSVVRNPDQYFKPSISWSDISSSGTSYKVYPSGFIFDVCGMSCFDAENPTNLLGVLNTKFIAKVSKVLNPTMHFQIGDFKKLPYVHLESERFNDMVEDCISISRQDWDAHETSWDFKENELVALAKQEESKGKSVKELLDDYKAKWEGLFMQLHENEEELNRQFIDIYGLQDELTPDVPLDEITILQQGEISIKKDE